MFHFSPKLNSHGTQAGRKACRSSLGVAVISIVSTLSLAGTAVALPELPELPSIDLPGVPSLPSISAGNDTLIASFFTSDADKSDILYSTDDGINFNELAVAYQDATPGDPGNNGSTQGEGHYTLSDPSIMYHNGYFWMLSGWNRNDGNFWPMIGVSEDGKNWSYPEGQAFNGGNYSGIAMNPAPAAGNDTVAPEWFKDRNVSVYIVFSAGSYGAFHGSPQNDSMSPYIVKVNDLSVTGFGDDPRLPFINFNPGVAQGIDLGQLPAGDRIDGSIFQDGLNYYLTIKRDGFTNEIWTSTDVSNPSGWSLVNGTVAVGFEGPYMTKFNGQYMLYADKLGDYPVGAADGSTGTFVFTAPSPEGPWSEGERIVTRDKAGNPVPNRHGSVYLVNDPVGKAKVEALR